MFKNLKDKLATQVNKTNQTLFSTILPTDFGSLSRDSDIRTSSISSRDENLENDSTSSDISQTNNYISPIRQFTLPSDIESEYGGDENNHEAITKLQQRLNIYKNKFTQLQKAYNEVEHENNQIKELLQKSQDTSIKRQTELREQIKLEREAKNQAEKELKLRDNQIEVLLRIQKESMPSDSEEVQALREKNTRFEKLLNQCKEKIRLHQEKQVDLMKERDDLLEQLKEKSMIKDHQSENPTIEVKEHFHSDINVLLHDKERLQEELQSIHLYVQQLQTDLQLRKQFDEDIQRERNEFKEKYENLEIVNKEYQQQIEQLNQEIIIFKQNLVTFDTLKIEHENLINELHQTKQAKDNIQSLLDQTIYKDKYEQIQQDKRLDDNSIDQIDELKVALNKLQHNYDQLTQTFNTQREAHLKEIDKLKYQQEIESDRIKLQLKDEHEKAIEILKNKFENTKNEHQDELKATVKNVQDQIIDLSSQISKRQEEIDRLQQLLDKQKKESNEELEKVQSEKNSFKEKFDSTTKQLENEFNEKINLERQLEMKQNEIIQLQNNIDQLNTTIKEHEQFRQTIEISQNNDQQLLEEKDKIIDILKQDYQKLNKEHEKQQEEINNLHQQLTSQFNEKDQQENERYSQLETKLNHILSEKSILENELDSLRLQMQTTEAIKNQNLKLEQTIKELETECDSYRNENAILKNEIVSLVNINEENTRRIDEFNNEKFDFEQEIIEKDRQIKERDEKIQEIELTLEQTKEKGDKLRQALQKSKESMNNYDQTDSRDAEIRLRKLTEEYEQRIKEQEIDFDAKLKSMAKEMSTQIDEKEQNYNRQLQEFIHSSYKTENDRIDNFERRANDAEQRAFLAEKEISKLEEEIKEKQLDYYRELQELRNEVQKLTREKPQTTEDFSQTTIEDLTHLNDGPHSLVFEPTEVDYLKQIVLAYMTGTDRLTMAKVICAVLRYTDNEKKLILEHEKLRQSRWLNPTA